MSQYELDCALDQHTAWLAHKAKAFPARLKGRDLSGLDFSARTLSCLNLFGCRLVEADFSGTNLSFADLGGANLSGANFSGAELYCANLFNAQYDASTQGLRSCCPEKGRLIGWISYLYGATIQLEIPEDAQRAAGTTSECRCSKARVLEIKDEDGNCLERFKPQFALFPTSYQVGEMLETVDFEPYRFADYLQFGSHYASAQEEAVYLTEMGIHFYLSKSLAEQKKRL